MVAIRCRWFSAFPLQLSFSIPGTTSHRSSEDSIAPVFPRFYCVPGTIKCAPESTKFPVTSNKWNQKTLEYYLRLEIHSSVAAFKTGRIFIEQLTILRRISRKRKKFPFLVNWGEKFTAGEGAQLGGFSQSRSVNLRTVKVMGRLIYLKKSFWCNWLYFLLICR